jgi:hypothetical protein
VRIAKRQPPNLVLIDDQCAAIDRRPRPELNGTNLKRPNLKPHV